MSVGVEYLRGESELHSWMHEGLIIACNLLLKHVDFGLRQKHDKVTNYVTKSFK